MIAVQSCEFTLLLIAGAYKGEAKQEDWRPLPGFLRKPCPKQWVKAGFFSST
jgi:hypothetical protein